LIIIVVFFNRDCKSGRASINVFEGCGYFSDYDGFAAFCKYRAFADHLALWHVNGVRAYGTPALGGDAALLAFVLGFG
jgi:hypothetical protein